MNCKEGDLALIISGKHKGTMVTCLKLISDKMELPEVLQATTRENIWLVDKEINWSYRNGNFIGYFPYTSDARLLPIRPDEVTSLSEEELLLLTLDV